MRHDDFEEDFNPYAPPKADLTMPPRRRGAGRWRDEPVFVSPLQVWRWFLSEEWWNQLVWLALVPALWGVERCCVFLILNGGIAIANVHIRYLLGLLCSPFFAAFAFLFIGRQLDADGGETGRGFAGALGDALLRALPFCLLYAALVFGYTTSAAALLPAIIPQLPDSPLLTVVILPIALGAGTAAMMLFSLLAEALAVMARQTFFVALFRAASALLHNWSTFAVAAVIFFFAVNGWEEINKGITAFAAKHGVGIWIKPASAFLTGVPKLMIVLSIPCLMARDMFYDDGTE